MRTPRREDFEMRPRNTDIQPPVLPIDRGDIMPPWINSFRELSHVTLCW